MEEAYQMKFTKTVESYESINQGKKSEQFLFFFKKSGERGKRSHLKQRSHHAQLLTL